MRKKSDNSVRDVRVAIYARKSNTDGVGDQMYTSIDAQLDMCRNYVKMREREGWRVVAEFSDMGVSGKSLDRPDFQRLLTAAENGEFDVILAYKLDRVSRSMYDFLSLLRRMDKLGVNLAMASQNFDTSTVDGRFNANLRMSFAEYEREMDSVRIREKLASTVERGLYVGGVPPYGYNRVNKCELEPNENAKWVTLIFDKFLAGVKRQAIAHWLNKKGVPYPATTRMKKLAHTRLWTCEQVTRFISNPVYMGRVRYKGSTFPGRHKPLVSEEVWNKAQKKLEAEKEEWRENVRNKPQTGPVHYPLLGILHCPHCGRLLRAHTNRGAGGRRLRYYVCHTHTRRDLKEPCPFVGLPADAIEEALLEQVSKLAENKRLTELLHKRVPVLTRREITRALSNASAMFTYLQPEQMAALMKLVFKSVTYDAEKEILSVERYL